MIDKETFFRYHKEIEEFGKSLVPKLSIYSGNYIVDPATIELSLYGVEFEGLVSPIKKKFFCVRWSFFDNPEEYIRREQAEDEKTKAFQM